MVNDTNFSYKARRDLLLVNRARKGDQEAFTELMGLYREPLFYLLLKMVKNKSDAEDLTIEAFEKAFRKIESYNKDYAFSTWLYKIASNHGIDFLRKKNSSETHISIDKNEDLDNDEYYKTIFIPEDAPNPEEKIVNKQRKQLLKSLIKRLPPDYRRILVLRFYEEYSYNEIAEKLDIPIGTVKARLFRSRELLAGIIQKHTERHSPL